MIRPQVVRPDDPAERRGYEQAMADRCEVDGHKWEYGLTALFQQVQVCEWCGAYK